MSGPMTRFPGFGHHRGCPDRTQTHTFTGRHGDQMMGCHACGRNQPLAQAPQPLPDPEPTPLALTGWVCRDHYHPVTRAGKGCPACASARGKRRRR